jgi:hypothetical protein
MKNDFIRIYSAIELKEQVAFQQYVQFFYSGQKTVLSVFDEIIKAASINEEKEKEAAFYAVRKKVEGKEPEKMREQKNRLNAFDDLKKWLLDFLALQEIRENGIEAQFLKLEALRKRKLIDAFQQKSTKLTSDLDKQKSPNLWHLFWKMRLSYLNFFGITLDRLKDDYQPNLSELMASLDDFYISAKLMYSAELHNRSKVTQDKYKIILLDEVLRLLETQVPKQSVIYRVYKPLIELVKENSYSAYLQLKQFIIEQPQHDLLERQSILLHLLNYTTRQPNNEDETFILESFELYDIGIQQSIFTVSGYFSINTYLNIVNTACRLKKFDWIEIMLDQCGKHLPPTEKDETIIIAKSRVAFEEERFPDVLTLLLNKKSKNFNFELNMRLLRLRAYYEMRNTHNFTHSFLHSDNENLYFYVFRSKKIGGLTQQRALNFYKIYRSLISEKSKKNQLFKELGENPDTTYCYDWFKIKIGKLLK